MVKKIKKTEVQFRESGAVDIITLVTLVSEEIKVKTLSCFRSSGP